MQKSALFKKRNDQIIGFFFVLCTYLYFERLASKVSKSIADNGLLK